MHRERCREMENVPLVTEIEHNVTEDSGDRDVKGRIGRVFARHEMKKIVLSALLISFALAAGVFAQTRPGRKTTAKPTVKKAVTSAPDPALDGPPPPPPSFSDEEIVVDTNLVTTPVSVLDRNGRFLPGLQKKDFKIFENGVQQKVEYFQSEEKPFTVVLLIDISPSTKYSIDEIHYAAVTFINQLRPTDQVVVVAFDQRVRVLTEPTTDKKVLYSAIYKAQFGSGTSLYDAVNSAIGLDLITVPGRKAIVLFTDGVDTTSRTADYASTLSSVEEVDSLFYTIRYNTQRKEADAQPVPTAETNPNLPPDVLAALARGQSDAEYQTGRKYLDLLAEYSGGRTFDADALTNLETSFSNVAEELRRQYAVGYYPSDTGKPGDRKKIKIEIVAKPQAVVRSKTSYVIKGNEPAAAANPSAETKPGS